MSALEPKGKLIGIEAGRGLAATAVVFYHAARHLNFVFKSTRLMSLFQFGHSGVDFFFVISGFIILYVHYKDIDHPSRVPHYLERRFTRVMPIYWVALAATVGLRFAARHEVPGVSHFVSSLLLLPTHREPLLGVAWSMEYEVVFYVFFLMLLLNRIAGAIGFSLWLVLVVAKLEWNAADVLPPAIVGVYCLEFFLGMGVALWLRHRTLRAPKLILTTGATLFLVAGICENIHLLNGYGNLARAAYGFPAAIIVLGAAEASRQNRLAVPRLLRLLGSASYSIYLFQFVFMGMLWKVWLAAGLDRTAPAIACFPVLVVGGVAGGVLMSRLVEYPMMKFVRSGRLWPARRLDPVQ